MRITLLILLFIGTIKATDYAGMEQDSTIPSPESYKDATKEFLHVAYLDDACDTLTIQLFTTFLARSKYSSIDGFRRTQMD
jgi:hypothetical protein